MNSTKKLLFENIQKLEPEFKLNEGVLQEELQKELTPINKRVANRLFKLGNVIYIRHAAGVPDSQHNLFTLRKDKWDGSMNIYTGGVKPEILGLDFILKWIEDKSDGFIPSIYTLFSPEMWIIENGAVIKEKPNSVDEVGPRTAAKGLNYRSDERGDRLNKDVITSLFSKFINRDINFFMKTRSNSPNVKENNYKLVEVLFKRDKENTLKLYFHSEDAEDVYGDAPYGDSKKQFTAEYSIEKDAYLYESSMYQYSPAAVNFLIYAANLIRQMYFEYKPITKLANPDQRYNPEYVIDKEATEAAKKSRLTKQNFNMFSFDRNTIR